MQRANDLAREQKQNFGDDIAVQVSPMKSSTTKRACKDFTIYLLQLRIARKKRWNLQEEKRVQQEIELQSYLNRLILEDKDRKAEDLRNTGEDVDVLVSLF